MAGCAASQGSDRPAVAWAVSRGPVDYLGAVAAMEKRVAQIAAGDAREMIWLLEHPALYTAGTSARPEDLLQGDRFPVHRTGRGGQYTYHGPGQRVVYVMLDLKRRGGDIRKFVSALETWVIAALAAYGVEGVVRPGRVGVWVERRDCGMAREDKIAAIGVRVRRAISFHGLSINASPALSHFDGIVPCGIRGHGVTSLVDLGQRADLAILDEVLRSTFSDVFSDRLADEAAPL